MMLIKIVTILVLSTSSFAVLPPGYEDEMWCPPGYCDRQINYASGITGPSSIFHECYNSKLNETMKGIWTGSLTDVTAPVEYISVPNLLQCNATRLVGSLPTKPLESSVPIVSKDSVPIVSKDSVSIVSKDSSPNEANEEASNSSPKEANEEASNSSPKEANEEASNLTPNEANEEASNSTASRKFVSLHTVLFGGLLLSYFV